MAYTLNDDNDDDDDDDDDLYGYGTWSLTLRVQHN